LQDARQEVEANARVVSLWRQAGRTQRTRLFAGWVPRSSSETVTTEAAAATESRVLHAAAQPSPVDNLPGVTPPTLLKNPPPLRPFEGLTRTYGLPSYWDLDPTALAALLFLLMFGMMFGDVGQGAVLVIAGGALASGRIVPGQRDFGRILAAAGSAAMLFGVLYGNVFGTELLIPALWFRPRENPVLVLSAAIVLGVTVLSIGLIFGIASAWRRRDVVALLLGQNGLVGLWLYWGLLASIAMAVVVHERLSALVLALLVGLPLLLLFLHGPIASAFGWAREAATATYAIQAGVESLDLLIRFASNTLSFLRIGAFALGHAGLGVTMFALANLVRTLPGASAVVLVSGNAVIIALEVLVVGIQALRLEYYEFFSKFLQGGGVAYQPFVLRVRRAAASDCSEREV